MDPLILIFLVALVITLVALRRHVIALREQEYYDQQKPQEAPQ